MKECIVLGSGNSFNINGRGHTSFLIDGEILVDCGPTILYNIEKFKIDISNLQIILITHFHGDHFLGLPFVMLYFEYIVHRKQPITIIGPKGLKKNYKKLLNLSYPGIEFSFQIPIIELKKNQTITTYVNNKHYTIKSYPITHKKESIGYRITNNNKTFAFTGDTILNEQVYHLLEDVNIGILELSLQDNPENKISHVSLSEVLQNRDKIKAKKLYFNHITDKLSKEVKKINKKIKNFGIPLYDGMKIKF